MALYAVEKDAYTDSVHQVTKEGGIALRGAGRNFSKGLKWSWNIYPRPSPASNRGISSEHSPNLIKHTGFIAKLMIPWTSGNSI